MLTVKDLLEQKGHDCWHVNPKSTVYEALQKMAEKDIGALLVLENDNLAGIFTERDYARKVTLHGKSSKDTTVAEFMVKQLVLVGTETTIEDCMALMTEKRVRHLPVMENHQVIGIVSIGDIVNAVIKDRDIKIKNLENYIMGSRYGS